MCALGPAGSQYPGVNVDWQAELAERDMEGLVTAEKVSFAETLAKDAEEQLAAQFPQAYKILSTHRPRVLARLVTDAVFRVLRNEASGGYSSESDGVYSYSFSAYSTSPDIWWTSSEVALLESLVPKFALGPLRRGGLTR